MRILKAIGKAFLTLIAFIAILVAIAFIGMYLYIMWWILLILLFICLFMGYYEDED